MMTTAKVYLNVIYLWLIFIALGDGQIFPGMPRNIFQQQNNPQRMPRNFPPLFDPPLLEPNMRPFPRQDLHRFPEEDPLLHIMEEEMALEKASIGPQNPNFPSPTFFPHRPISNFRNSREFRPDYIGSHGPDPFVTNSPQRNPFLTPFQQTNPFSPRPSPFFSTPPQQANRFNSQPNQFFSTPPQQANPSTFQRNPFISTPHEPVTPEYRPRIPDSMGPKPPSSSFTGFQETIPTPGLQQSTPTSINSQQTNPGFIGPQQIIPTFNSPQETTLFDFQQSYPTIPQPGNPTIPQQDNPTMPQQGNPIIPQQSNPTSTIPQQNNPTIPQQGNPIIPQQGNPTSTIRQQTINFQPTYQGSTSPQQTNSDSVVTQQTDSDSPGPMQSDSDSMGPQTTYPNLADRQKTIPISDSTQSISSGSVSSSTASTAPQQDTSPSVMPQQDSYPISRYSYRFEGQKPGLPSNDQLKGFKIVCLFNNRHYYKNGFTPGKLEPGLCTHLNYEFAILDPTTHEIIIGEPDLDIGRNFYKEVIDLKGHDPNLKVLISLGGWSDSTKKYSELAASPKLRKKFVETTVVFLKSHGFDGLDFAWEYPNCWQGAIGANPDDKANFVILLKELKEAFEKEKDILLILSVSVGAIKREVKAAYDVRGISNTVDYINVMTYDMHGPWESKTAHHTQFEKLPGDTDPDCNVKAAMKVWTDMGADKKKLNMGIPMYGRSFTLAEPHHCGLGVPAKGPGNPGPYTNEGGILNYNEICKYLHSGNWTEKENERAGFYACSGDQLVCFDPPKQVVKKAKFIVDEGLSGALIKDLSGDDFQGNCFNMSFPCVKMARLEMIHRAKDKESRKS